MTATESRTALSSPERRGPSSNKPKSGKLPGGAHVQKPNLDEYSAKIDVMQKDINSLHKKLDGINLRIQDLTKGNTEFHQKREELRSKVDGIQQKMDKLEVVRNRLLTQIEDTAKSGRDTKVKIQGLKKALGFQTSEEIDEKIRLIERHMMMTRLTVTEENKLVSEMRRLEKSKPLVDKYANMETEITNNAQSETLQLRIDFDNIKDELKILQQKKREFNEALGSLVQGHNKETAPIRELSDEKDEIRRGLCEKRAEMNQLRDEMFKKRREYEAHQEIVSRAQRETLAEERKKRTLERQREEIQNELEDIGDAGWSPQLQLVTQTICYVARLVERGKQITAAGSVNEPDENISKEANRSCAVAGEEDGMVAMVPKKDREEELYFKPTKQKAGKKAKKQQPSSQCLRQPLVHDIVTLSDFSRLGVDAPLTLDHCPALLQTLEEKRDLMKKEHSRNIEVTQQRKAELVAKLEGLKIYALEENQRLEESQRAKAINGSPVEIEAV